MQSSDHYTTDTSSTRPKLTGQGGASSKEFATRLTAYAKKVDKGAVQVGGVTRRIVRSIYSINADLNTLETRLKQATERYKTVAGWSISVQKHEQLESVKKKKATFERQYTNVKEFVERFGDLIQGIVEMEERWEYNLFQATEAAEKAVDDNQKLFREHAEGRTLLHGLDTLQETVKRRTSHYQTVSNWRTSVMKYKQLEDAQKKKTAAEARLRQAQEKAAKLKNRYGKDYFEGLRVYLRGAGFIVSPSYLPPAAVFPAEDWIKVTSSTHPYTTLAKISDKLMVKYGVLGSGYRGVLFRDAAYRERSKIGCVCVSWTILDAMSYKGRFYVPVLGFSGKSPAPPEKKSDTLEAVLGACALPPFASADGSPFGSNVDPHDSAVTQGVSKYTTYYDDVIIRANNLAINYRVRKMLNMRLPSRQAMLSYLGLNFKQGVKLSDKKKDFPLLCSPSPAIARWHSLNCAEPAALAWISCFFADGRDVILCCPYEGGDDPGVRGLKPKETCPWCATVELAYRSLGVVKTNEEWKRKYDLGMKKGEWEKRITIAEVHNSEDRYKSARQNLPRNKRQFDLAYPMEVNENVAILRELFSELGLLTSDTVRVDNLPLWSNH